MTVTGLGRVMNWCYEKEMKTLDMHEVISCGTLNTCKSLPAVGLSDGFFCKQESTKCRNTSDQLGDESIGLSFWAM